jgi:uncharacterized protein (DUF433 family)
LRAELTSLDNEAIREWRSLMEPLITRSPDVMSGTPVFAGTRVPVQHLLDYLVGGDAIGEFLEDFPTVSREQVEQFLQVAAHRMMEATHEDTA